MNVIQANVKKRYCNLFKERFNVSIDIPNLNNDGESMLGYIGKIEEEYKKIICAIMETEDEDAVRKYIRNEKIRLVARNKELSKKKLGVKYISSVVPMTLSIITFALGIVIVNVNNLVGFAINNKLIELDLLKEKDLCQSLDEYITGMNNLNDINSDYLQSTNNIITRGIGIILIMIIVGYILLETINSYNVKRNNIDITFNTFCLEIVTSIENEDFNILCVNEEEVNT